MFGIFNNLGKRQLSENDLCDRLGNQIFELHSRGCFEQGQKFTVGLFTASISKDGWDYAIERDGKPLMLRMPLVSISGYVCQIDCKLDTTDKNWLAEWDAAYKQTLAAHPKGIGYHLQMALRRSINTFV